MSQVLITHIVNELTAGGLNVEQATILAQRLCNSFYITYKLTQPIQVIINELFGDIQLNDTDGFNNLVKLLEISRGVITYERRSAFIILLGLNPDNFILEGEINDFVINMLHRIFTDESIDHKELLSLILTEIKHDGALNVTIQIVDSLISALQS